MYDLVIRGGLLIDGTGKPGRLADVGITGDLIVAVDGEPLTDADTLHRTMTEATIGRPLTLRVVRMTSLRELEVTPERAGG